MEAKRLRREDKLHSEYMGILLAVGLPPFDEYIDYEWDDNLGEPGRMQLRVQEQPTQAAISIFYRMAFAYHIVDKQPASKTRGNLSIYGKSLR